MGGGTGGCLGAVGAIGAAGVEWAGIAGGVEWAGMAGKVEWVGIAGGVGWAGMAGKVERVGISRSPAVTGGMGLVREESSTFKDTVRGGGLAMGGAADDDADEDDDDDEEEGGEDGTGASSEEEEAAISHLGGRMACLLGGCDSLVKVLAGLGSGTNRTPSDPNGEHKTHAQTYINTANKIHTSAQHSHNSRHKYIRHSILTVAVRCRSTLKTPLTKKWEIFGLYQLLNNIHGMNPSIFPTSTVSIVKIPTLESSHFMGSLTPLCFEQNFSHTVSNCISFLSLPPHPK